MHPWALPNGRRAVVKRDDLTGRHHTGRFADLPVIATTAAGLLAIGLATQDCRCAVRAGRGKPRADPY